MGWFTAKPEKPNQEQVRPGRQGDQLRVEQLELQLQELATTAAQAVDRAEGLETELSQLKQERDELKKTRHCATPSHGSTTTSNYDNSLYSAPSRSSSFTTINSTRSNSDQQDQDINSLRKRIRELQDTNLELTQKLHSEQQSRQDCEARETSLSSQIEDLSANLFEEANRKVQMERQKCAIVEQKLKRVDVGTLERDQRWHNIEIAISAIHKARSTLNSAHLHHYI